MSELSKRLKQWASDLSEWMDMPELLPDGVKQKVADLLAAADAIEAGGKLAAALNGATPEQQAEAMTKCTPAQEEWARRFEDSGEAQR